jgi:hypothetical protein
MLIKVIYRNNSADMVKDYLLEGLIASGKIVAFRRSSGWVTIGIDRVRNGRRDYAGPERRRGGILSTYFG